MAEQTINTNQQPKKKNYKKAILIGLGVAATAVGGFFGWKWLKGKDNVTHTENDADDAGETKSQTSSSSSSQSSGSGSSGSSWMNTSTPTTPVRKDEFPLKKGSKGERVKAVQDALLYKYGKTILPKYGADGDFGSELEAGLTKAGYPKQIDESLYNIILKSGSLNAKSTATNLKKAIDSKSYQGILDTVKTIRNLTDYKAVNEEYKKFTDWFLPPVQVVTAAIAPFLSSDQRDKMRLEFIRIGLKFDGKVWTLSGLPAQEHPLLITTAPTELIDPKNKVKVKVPAKMVVGYKLKEKNGLTLMRLLERNLKVIVKSSTVKIYEKH
ncbi:MAG TPA: hypothetical protein DEP18_09060 [Flavobacteriales bacterium]|nr:hypothetical protein [Flavobacteriales bacterium]HRE97750.1 hypothetical protein [Flavobacteriales bacterium]HRJ36393.1 hypothetical protein [Flavobacteriales bacterium]HRJ39380.1 hypothetical protein [Flavobacteriales bacterium]